MRMRLDGYGLLMGSGMRVRTPTILPKAAAAYGTLQQAEHVHEHQPTNSVNSLASGCCFNHCTASMSTLLVPPSITSALSGR